MTRCDECGAVMGFCLCAVRKREAVERVARNEWAFYAAHDGHDVGWRHEDGRLYSATCHDCGDSYPVIPARNEATL